MRIGENDYRIPDISFKTVTDLERITGQTFNELVNQMQRGSMTATAILFSIAVDYDIDKATDLISQFFVEGGSMDELTKEINKALDESSFFKALLRTKKKQVRRSKIQLNGECILKMWLPQCLSIGISYELFWTLNPKKLQPFFEAEKIKQEQKYKDINYTAWLNGMYVASAISACFSKNTKYPEKPYEAKKEEENWTHAERFGAWAIAFNNAHKDLPD